MAMSKDKIQEYIRKNKGEIPSIIQSEYTVSLMRYLTWHNIHSSQKDFLTWIGSYSTTLLDKSDLMNDRELRQIASLILIKEELSSNDTITLNNMINDVLSRTKKPKSKPVKKVLTTIDSSSVNEEKINDSIGNVLAAVDRFILSGDANYLKYNFDNLSKDVLNSISEYFSKSLNLLKENNELSADENGYSNLSLKNRVKLEKFYSDIIDDCKVKRVIKKISSIKKKSVASIARIASKIDYNKQNEYGIKSESPMKVVDCNEYFTFNVKTRIMTKYVSGSGLSLNGKSIINFDEKKTISKKIRKPELIVNLNTKKEFNSFFDALTTKGSFPSGRINVDTVLLKGF